MLPETHRLGFGSSPTFHLNAGQNLRSPNSPLGNWDLSQISKIKYEIPVTTTLTEIVTPHVFFSIIPKRKIKISRAMGMKPNIYIKKA